MIAKQHRVLFLGAIAAGMLLAVGLFELLPAIASDDTLDAGRAKFAAMDAAERDQIAQNYERFLHLDPEERERLRQLHAEIESDPDRDALRVVMQNYHEWLEKLSPVQRVKLAAMPVDERLKQIGEMLSRERNRMRLSPEDLHAVEVWSTKHNLFRLGRRQGNERPELPRQALDELQASLSEPARRALDDAKTPEERLRLVMSWMQQVRRSPGFPGGGPGFRWPSLGELRDFLNNELTEEERTHLRQLPEDQMQGELRRLWRERHPPQRGRGPGGPPPDRVPSERSAPDRENRSSDAPSKS